MSKNLYQEVTQRIVDQLKAGTVPWCQPWTSKDGSVMPRNAITGRGYSGVNVLLLWCTAQDYGALVRAPTLGKEAQNEIHD
jgi:antirestriction protein ArdC